MVKKYLSLERLEEYDELIKSVISAGDDAVKSSLTSGTTVVKNAEHATTADSATSATTATTADTANAVAWANVTGKPSTYTPSSHNHNDLYYTETEVDNLLAGKSDTSHNHDGDYDAAGTAQTKADAALESAKTYTNTAVSGLASTTSVTNAISTHNASTTAHSDIRDLISALTTKVNNFLDVDDTTTDQLSEVLTLIENNKGTLESLTSSKVNVSDIVDNLTTSNASKVLSAKQGVALKALIDALQEEFDAHTHEIADVTGLQSALDGKAASSHGTHVSFDSTNKPKMDGTAAFGTSTKVARADHVHPTDTSRASQVDLDAHVGDTTKHITSTERTNWGAAYTHSQAVHAPSNAQANVIESIKVNGAAQTVTSKAVNITVPTKASDIGAATSSHTHAISDITNLQATLTNASSAISANTSSITALTDRTVALETKVGDGFSEITSEEIQNLFSK